MAIDLLGIQPHKVSRDLSGYITYIYGAPKTGKTTLATQMPNALLLAFERGYNALPGVMAQDITTWGEMKQVYKELKKPAVKEIYKSIIVDTVDEASEMCQKYICQQKGIESLGDLGYGKGWSAFNTEFAEVFRGLTQMGYAVFFIGHDKEVNITNNDGNVERVVIRPRLGGKASVIVSGMADIYGYAHQKNKGEMSVLTLRCGDDSIECGGRFKYIKSEFPMSYENLVNAVSEAIDKEAEEHGNEYVTDEKETITQKPVYDFDELMAEFQTLAGDIMTANASNSSKITAIIEKYLGKKKKIAEATPEQAEMVYLIIQDLKDLREDLMDINNI